MEHVAHGYDHDAYDMERVWYSMGNIILHNPLYTQYEERERQRERERERQREVDI